MKSSQKANFLTCVIFVFLSVLLYFADFSPVKVSDEGTKEKARVLQVDNSNLIKLGLLQKGEQMLKVEVLSGKHKGEFFNAQNVLRAQADLDKIFKDGDTILVAVLHDATPQTHTLNAQDFYRINYTILLFFLFAILLILFGGLVGFKALISFVFSCLVIWKIVVPACLLGYSPIFVSLVAVLILSVVIIFLVAGFTKKGTTVLSGTLLGVLASCLMAWIFTHLFNINGATAHFSQALLYSGYENLNLAELFIGGIFLSSSGAVMDLSMDVASGQDELRLLDSNFKNLLMSGLRIGRSVVGTMSTTLLLAYAGGYLTLMMAFMAQGTSPFDFLNNPYIASEVVKTLVGSFGLVLVAPFTALSGAFIMSQKNKNLPEEK